VRRRDFITLLSGGATVAWPITARAQQNGKIIRIGFIGASLNNPSMAAQYETLSSRIAQAGIQRGAKYFNRLQT
jgi:aspartate aminotransferase-like enzyme